MAQFGAGGKNPPWARTSTDFTAAAGGISQPMMNPNVAATQQAVYNLAAQQSLQNQFQAQQMAAATMQNAMQQQAILPQPGIALPTSLASANMNTISYPSMRAPAQPQAQQPKQRVFTGTVSKLHDNFGFVDEDVFFQTTCVKGTMPKVGDRVLVEAQFNANMPFKWNATSVKLLNNQGATAANTSGLGGSKFGPVNQVKTGFGNTQPPSLLDQSTVRSRNDRLRGTGSRNFDRDRGRRRDDRDRRDRDSIKSGDHDSGDSSKKRSRSPKRSTSPAKRSRSPTRRRPRIAPRYVVQTPKASLNMKEASVVTLKPRYTNMYIPSDFFTADFPWTDSFPLLRPFQLGKPCTFHVMHRDVERLSQSTISIEPPDADHLFSAKVMLIASPSLDDLYHKSCSLSQDPESVQDGFVHPTRLINFLVGVKGKNEPIAIGGPWSPSLDGLNPADDPKVLIKTAIRTTKALTGINLSSCTQWYRYAEVRYLRPEEHHKGKLVPARVETTVIFLPDVWSCQPTRLEWESLQLSYKKQLQKKLSQLENKDESQDDEEEGETSIGEKKDPTHFSELDPKSMKIIDLRRELEYRNLSSKGLKSQLIARLTKVLKTEQEQEEEDAANKPPTPEEPVEEETMETEVDEEQRKKDEEERKKEEDKLRVALDKKYTLPEKTSILVYPNTSAKGGKFDCSVMSLSVLLDYRPEDNKEHSFEVSLFAELFNEMLMRDFGFILYKELNTAPEKTKDEKKDKEKEKEKEKEKDKDKDKKKEKEDEPAAKKKKTDDKDKKDGDKKDDDSEKKISIKEEKDDKKEKEEEKKKEKKEKKKYRTVNANLLLSCIYFDQNHTGYILDKDLEEIIHCIGLSLSRAQVKKLVSKVTSRDSFHYRKLTDQVINEDEASQETVKLEVDFEELAKGNVCFMVKEDGNSAGRRKGAGARSSDEPLTGMVMYNGAMVDIENVLERLEKGDASLVDYESKLKDLTDEKEQLKRDLKKKEDAYNKSLDSIKTLKQDLSTQEKITSNSEATNKKYLSALINSQSLLNNMVSTVTGALGDMAEFKVEKVKKEKEKEETNGKSTIILE